MQRVYK